MLTRDAFLRSSSIFATGLLMLACQGRELETAAGRDGGVSSFTGASGRLEPDVVIGVVDGPAPYTFGRVTASAFGDSGTILVLDGQAQIVRRYDRNGRFQSEVAGAGDGPGELRSADLLGASPETIVVGESSSGRVHAYSSNGDLWWTRRLGHAIDGPFAFTRDGDVLVRFASAVPRRVRGAALWLAVDTDTLSRGGRILRIDRAGEVLDTLVAPALEPLDSSVGVSDDPRMLVGTVFSPYSWWSWTPIGEILTGRTDRYEIWVHDPWPGAENADEASPGTRSVQIGRRRFISLDVPPVALGPKIRDAVHAQYDALVGPGDVTGGVGVPTHTPAYRRALVAEGGRVWIRRDFPTTYAESAFPMEIDWVWGESVFDVFDSSGHPVGEVRGPALDVAEIRGDTVLATTRGPSDIHTVTRFVVRWN